MIFFAIFRHQKIRDWCQKKCFLSTAIADIQFKILYTIKIMMPISVTGRFFLMSNILYWAVRTAPFKNLLSKTLKGFFETRWVQSFDNPCFYSREKVRYSGLWNQIIKIPIIWQEEVSIPHEGIFFFHLWRGLIGLGRAYKNSF